MKDIFNVWLKIGKLSHVLAGAFLATMFLLTLAEVVGRFFWRPIAGSYELISFLGGLVIGFSVTYTSQKDSHINVDFLINKMSTSRKMVMKATTRIMVMAFFVLVGCSLIYMGIDLRSTHEVSQTLKLPYYPVAFGLGVSFLIQAGQFLLDIVEIYGGNNE